jgi:hypothetical protein
MKKIQSFKFSSLDVTHDLQKVLDSNTQRIIIEDSGHPLTVGPIHLRPNKELVFKEGVVIEARRDAFYHHKDCLFSAIDCKNLKIYGNNTIFKMNKDDYNKGSYSPGEWRHCLMLRGCKNVLISGLTCKDSGGDGICLGSHNNNPNKNVIIRNVVCDNNFRQGLTVGCANKLYITDCVFKNTRGTAPNTGINFEPNNRLEQLINIKVFNCIATGNIGNGFLVDLHNLTRNSRPVSIQFENCLSHNNRWYGACVKVGDADPVKGFVIFNRQSSLYDQKEGQWIIENTQKTCQIAFNHFRLIK